MNFGHPPESINEILQLISRSNAGRTALESFLPHYHRQKIVIRQYPAPVIEKMRGILGEGQPIGAAFVIEDGQGIIFIDLESPLGIVAPFLVHEIIHSMDKALWENQDISMTEKERSQLLLRAETKAFEYQHRFVQELSARYPDYKEFLTQHQAKVKVLVNKLTQTDIAELYGFKIA